MGVTSTGFIAMNAEHACSQPERRGAIALGRVEWPTESRSGCSARMALLCSRSDATDLQRVDGTALTSSAITGTASVGTHWETITCCSSIQLTLFAYRLQPVRPSSTPQQATSAALTSEIHVADEI